MALDTARVIWSEGLFLRPHHFQQLERHFEDLVASRLGGVCVDYNGFLKLSVDPSLLLQGKVHISSAVGLFPDGTPFELPSEACLLLPFDVPEGVRDQVVYLSTVVRRVGTKAVKLDARDPTSRRTRYVAVDATVTDNIVGFDAEADVKVGALNLSLGLKSALDGSLTTLPVARIVERRADGSVLLDPKFISPLLDIAAHARTQSWLDELHGLIAQRADAMAVRLGGPATSGVGENVDFLLLMLCNRYEPLLAQMRQTSPLHPLHLFSELLKLAGEAATFGREGRRPPKFPVYKHLALAESFEPVVEEIRRAMTAVLDQSAVRIPLRDLGQGVYRADIPDPRLVSSGFFVLAAAAQVPSEQLRALIPKQLKVSPPEKLKDLVMLNLPGIQLEPLQYPPRQIPFHASYSYFQLGANNSLWKSIELSRAMGLHVAGEPPGLELQLWAIRT